jgi:hypothetical protein
VISIIMDPYNPILPLDHPHSGQRILGEIEHTNNTPRPKDAKSGKPVYSHKKTLSTISLRSLGIEKDNKPKDKANPRSKSSRAEPQEKEPVETPKKSKSSSGLASVFSKNRSPKKEGHKDIILKDQENTTPPGSAATAAHTPIWAQFASTPANDSNKTTSKVPLNDDKKLNKRALAAEMNLYMPKQTEQRNFYGYNQQPSRPERPKSGISGNDVHSSSMFEPLARKSSSGRPKIRHANSDTVNPGKEKKSALDSKVDLKTSPKKGSRVMAAVNMFNGKAKMIDVEPKLDPKQIDAEFEAVLVSRWCKMTIKTTKINDLNRNREISQRSCDHRCVNSRPV